MNSSRRNNAALPAFADRLKRFQARVEHALDTRLLSATAAPSHLHAAMRYATLEGGKRVRASLVYATGEAVGAPDSALDVPACAVELIHAYSLVHDDLPCMDDDDLRRGKPTCHKAYDEATALLAGDALQSYAFEILANDPTLMVSAAQRLRMIALLAQAAGSHGMAGGQAIDLASGGRELALPQLENMHRRKTGALIRAAVLLGALVREDVAEAKLKALEDYSHAIGLAFQITDDILDMEGTTETLGKNTGVDRARGKPTYPLLLGLSAAKARANALHAEALESLAPLGDNGSVLAELAGFIIERRQ
ncbi:MAG: geranyl transferase [Candidatus Muproteobacteria bacterium RIFCSPHIGHO2_12_FULL_60_33]|uniref:Geranyl transferase n=1 Tax=Candidatus Muproteobacteria bacterium RIFCSPLOWO2_01_FULL_60_18 TaxID=1817768 RepID=A0A1F6U1S2_9PROT|nr:MAG: geranyl transferase [Candidatus Muproteobacteria bacterium RIFCSPLOWO2_01_FULL_60_18]OGI53168.1 MAG: geranyl transferase [Candidatus Muproteobacteria bacterium RIFCSPHIGHO2_01_60_12]OGI56116.1 MAG: geranyl transferase [Candidatus Muproteobacteria bacterium RIFCSPHIGHO2_12_FULL_60_33]OGI57943.1 MAG: geranyl transferase [Candidatus Muproteobacteria bacterium RIFCSPHIGHO2_01_FULL_61_200]